MTVLPGLSDDEQALLTKLTQRLQIKQTINQLRDAYYDGRRAINQVGSIIPPQYYKLAIVLGWAAKAVDILAHRCNLDSFVWPDGDLGSLGFKNVYDSNYLGSEINSAITLSLRHGPSFLINTLGDEDKGEPSGSIHIKDAGNATGTWDTRARRLTNLLSITSRDQSGEPDGLVLYIDNETIEARRTDPGSWEVDRTEHTWGVPADPMVFQYSVNQPFGRSRISPAVMSIHDRALRTIIRMEGHADIYSFPEMWLLGADESIFKNADGSQKAAWQVMLGRIKAVPDNDDAVSDALARPDVKQFSASSPQPHIDQLKQQAQEFAGETFIPLTSLGVSDMSNPTSADSYVASREDLICLAENTTDEYTRPLQRTMTRALAMQNGLKEIPAEWSSIAPKWRSPIYLSRAQQADAGLKQLTAVPWLADTEVGLELLGLDEQQIARAMAEKKRVSVTELVQSLSAASKTAQQNPLVADLITQPTGQNGT